MAFIFGTKDKVKASFQGVGTLFYTDEGRLTSPSPAPVLKSQDSSYLSNSAYAPFLAKAPETMEQIPSDPPIQGI